MNIFEKYALQTPDILIPNEKVDLSLWSVVACDQYTQDKHYWDTISSITNDLYSTRHIILPEVYLRHFSEKQRKNEVIRIQDNMNHYLNAGIFNSPVFSMMYIERKTSYGRMRKGIVTSIDLEKYDWQPSSKAEIRATEATVVDRLPPRMEIRQGASLELPHIMLLVNDADNILIEEIGRCIHETGESPLYNFALMMGSGSITGWAISEEISVNIMKDALEVLYKKNTGEDGSIFMFAIGDGNHSLAAAKSVWEKYKQKSGGILLENGLFSIPKSIENHPLRYALVEIVNLYDPGLTFEPIHRILFNTDIKKLIHFVQLKLGGLTVKCKDKEGFIRKIESSSSSFGFVSKTEGCICLETKLNCLAVSALQPVLDEFIDSEKQIDYIHGALDAINLSETDGIVSVILPPISKMSFFSTIAKYGSLPRKSFSMGEASEKRFYLECRKLTID